MFEEIKRANNPAESSYVPKASELFPSLVLILPLLLLYQLGLWATGFQMVNGVDFISGTLYSLFQLRGLLVFNLVAILAMVLGIAWLREGQGFSVRLFLVPAVLESLIYALLLGAAISFLMHRAVTFAVVDPSLDTVQKVTLSVGAGVNEELFFRFFLMGLIYFLAMDVLDMGGGSAFLMALILSSLLFSYAHYLGPTAAALDPIGFAYRFLAGVAFGLIYRFRSLAVAVYTHTLYDLLILFG